MNKHVASLFTLSLEVDFIAQQLGSPPNDQNEAVLTTTTDISVLHRSTSLHISPNHSSSTIPMGFFFFFFMKENY